jgi:hypothetical protein
VIDYFVSCVRTVLGPFLRSAGFDELTCTDTRVTFGCGDVAVSFAYYVEDLPEPWVAIDVGLAEPNGFKLFGVWRAIPSGSVAADYPTWRFFDKPTLESVLGRDLVEVLRPYAADLWMDREQIERILSTQADEVEDRYLANQRDADLRRARRAFDDGRFQDSIDAYAQVAPSALSASDRRHLYLARKEVSS